MNLDKVIAIDCDTSGICNSTGFPITHGYQMVSCALSLARWEDLRPIDDTKVLISPVEGCEWSMEAQKYHGYTRDDLERQGLSEEEAVEELGGFLAEHVGSSPIVFLGYSPGQVHIQFLKALFEKFDIHFKYSSMLLDIFPVAITTIGMSGKSLLLESFDDLGRKYTEMNSTDKVHNYLKIMRCIRSRWARLEKDAECRND